MILSSRSARDRSPERLLILAAAFLIIVLSGWDRGLQLGSGNIKVNHLIFLVLGPICSLYFRPYFAAFGRLLILLSCFLLMSAVIRFYVSDDISGLSFFVGLLLNMGMMVFLVSLMRQLRTSSIINLMVSSIVALVLLSCFDRVLNTLGLPNFSVFHSSYQSGQLWSSEPNWIAIQVGLLSVFCALIWPKGKLRLQKTIVIFALTIYPLVNLSRVGMGLIFLSLFVLGYRHNSKFLVSATSVYLVLVALTAFIALDLQAPSELYYDFISEDQNPRLVDAIFLMEVLEARGQTLFGIGFGDISPLTVEMNWRPTGYAVSNQMWLHLLLTLGYFGGIVLTIGIILHLWRAEPHERLFLILMLVTAQFHNSFLMPLFWVMYSLCTVLGANVRTKSLGSSYEANYLYK